MEKRREEQDKLYYKLTKPLRRVYDLLNILIDADFPLSKQEVSAYIGCSRPTLDRTIVDANMTINGFTSVEFTGFGLVLEANGYLNKRQVRALVGNQTFIVQFLSDLLLGNLTTLESWAVKHYLSVSVAYRQTKEVADYLEELDIHLLNENNYWYLSGDSWQIRFFYFQMLKEKAIVDELWVFENLDYKVLNTFVKSVAQELEVFLSPTVEYFYTLMIAIHLSMTDNPYAVETVNDEKFKFLLEDHAFDKPLALLEDYLERPLSASEKAMLVSSIELFPVKYLTDEAMHRRLIHSSLTDHNVHQLALDTYNVFYPDNKNLRMKINFLDVYAPLQLVKTYHEFNFDENPLSTNRKFRQSAGADFNGKINQLKEQIKDKKYAQYFFKNEEELTQQLYMVYKTFSQENQIEPVTITFLSEKGYVKEQFYRQQFLSLFADNRLQYISAQELHQNNLWSSVDLIVTDFTLARFEYDGRVFFISGTVTPDNMKKIEEVIVDLEIAKRHYLNG